MLGRARWRIRANHEKLILPSNARHRSALDWILQTQQSAVRRPREEFPARYNCETATYDNKKPSELVRPIEQRRCAKEMRMLSLPFAEINPKPESLRQKNIFLRVSSRVPRATSCTFNNPYARAAPQIGRLRVPLPLAQEAFGRRGSAFLPR
jgi:hypothetical protein